MESTSNDMLSMMHHHNELDVDQQHAAPRAFASIRPDPKDGIASLLNDNDVDAEPRKISDKEVDTYKEQDVSRAECGARPARRSCGSLCAKKSPL
jgi:hypothetical protein